jgi:hypothetical protein
MLIWRFGNNFLFGASMKIEVSFFAMLLIAPVLILDANATELVNKHAALIQQGCQMGRDDAKSGKSMDSAGISLKSSGDKYIELEALIRKEYEKCYTKNNLTTSSSPISSTENNSSGSETATVTAEEITKIEVNNNSELKLPPGTSEKPFAWFYDWVSVVDEAPNRYITEKKRAEEFRERFNESCQNAHLIRQNDKTLIDRWCNITGWKEFKLDSSALRDDQFKKQLEKMKKQIGYSEEAFRKYGERDVRNAFDRTKGSSFNYQMKNIEQQNVLPYLSGVSVALGNIKATNVAMGDLDEQIVAKRKKEYLAELGMIKKKRIEEKKKQNQSEKDELYLKQKPQADVLIEDICNLGKEDAQNLKVPLPDQYKSQAEVLDMIDGIEEYIATRYTECYDAELISLTCFEAGEDYMRCRNEGPPSEYVSLASNNMSIHDFDAEYEKCHAERKDLYAREKTERENASKNIQKYIDIYRKRGGYFINDYNECVDSIITVTKRLSRKMRSTVLSKSDLRSCEVESSLIEKYATTSCSCKYGVVVDTLSEHEFTEYSDDVLALIKSSHSKLGNKKSSRPDEVSLKNSLRHPDASTALFKKIGLECAR